MTWFSRLAIGFLCLAVLAGAAPAVDSAARFSTPKQAAMAFAKALEDGDVAGARAASIGTDEDYRILPLISGLVGAARQLREAGTEKFGDAGRAIVGCDAMSDLTQQVNASEERVEGNTASLIRVHDVDPMRLKRDADGEWKVDLAALSDKDAKARVIPLVQKVMTAAAADIRAGKYRTAAQANDAIGLQMFAVISEPAATRPSSPAQK